RAGGENLCGTLRQLRRRLRERDRKPDGPDLFGAAAVPQPGIPGEENRRQSDIPLRRRRPGLVWAGVRRPEGSPAMCRDNSGGEEVARPIARRSWATHRANAPASWEWQV